MPTPVATAVASAAAATTAAVASSNGIYIDPGSIWTVIKGIFGGGAFLAILVAVIAAIPSNRSAKTAARSLELEEKKAEAAEEKARMDGLRADLVRIAAELSQVKAERDRAEAERDHQRERAHTLQSALDMRLAGCERRGNMCLIPPPPGPQTPSEKSP